MILNFLIQKVRSKLGRMLSGQSVDTLSFNNVGCWLHFGGDWVI